MRIKKLELCGFKSFKDRTVIHFDQGITGIVGPNGCGKSNIVDALVWVMGEMSAKHLRGSSMEDVIFAGADGYAPMGMAEVSLTLENDGGLFPAQYAKLSELMLTRRLLRSGESTYLINKEPARLRDIQEVFMDTGAGSKGFSIVEQGAIGKIITSKPEDRRVLIEEAAGITKFRARKKESQRKLESTDQNLVRLQDILSEQKRQLDSLQRQAQRAERYRNLKRELQEKELWLFSQNYLRNHGEVLQCGKVLEHLDVTIAGNESSLSQVESQLQSHKLELLENEKNVNEQQTLSQQKTLEVQNLEKEIRELKFEIEQARRSEAMSGQVKSQYQAREQALILQENELGEKYSQSQTTAAELTQQYEVQLAIFKEMQQSIKQIDEDLTQSRREMFTVSQSESQLSARETILLEKTAELEFRLETARAISLDLEKQCKDLEKRYQRIHNQLDGERQLQFDIMKDVENFQSNVESLKHQVLERHQEIEKFKDELNAVTSRLYGLENLQTNFEGFAEGAKNVMMWQRSRQSLRADGSSEINIEFQPVAEVIEVPAQYEMAMEATLGQRLQLLLSKSGDAALGAVGYLKENKGGRSSFATEEWLHEPSFSEDSAQKLREQKGVIGFLENVIEVPDSFKAQVHPFLSRVVMVESLNCAMNLRQQFKGYTYVTLDGDTLSFDGVLTGGTTEQVETGVLKRRREIKELSLSRNELSGKLALSQALHKKLENQLKSVNDDLEKSHSKQNEKELTILALKKDSERAEIEFNNGKKAWERQKQDVAKDEVQLLNTQNDLETIKEKLVDLRSQSLSLTEKVEQLTKKYNESSECREDLNRVVTTLQVESGAKLKESLSLKNQLNVVTDSLREVQEQLEKMSEDSLKNNTSLSNHQIALEHRTVELEQKIRENHSMQQVLADCRNQFEIKAQKTQEMQKNVTELYHQLNSEKTELGELKLKNEQLKMKEKYLQDQIYERYGLVLSDYVSNVVLSNDSESMTKTEEELKELKEKMNKIGEVNLSAIQEYDDLMNRSQFLNQQYQDLIQAKDQLKKVIERINKICTKRFKETFDQVNERFMKVFPVLFGGGEARLILIEDPEKEDVGIDIVSRPPGKKMQNVTLLSGGEKALTAVSLIFSIFLVKPSPFCLLDEVDAPLDDANVFRFNDLVKEMAKRSQIIVVTHNKYTMRVNNKLYGVTMEEKGVSKMVSVSLDNVAQMEKFASA
ncbi:MAG: chromosome segregation protein SMC [Bdellovibrionales bacterium]|nr:chromosome segregation protein SMC [Bdellovibrionales bacterium]